MTELTVVLAVMAIFSPCAAVQPDYLPENTFRELDHYENNRIDPDESEFAARSADEDDDEPSNDEPDDDEPDDQQNERPKARGRGRNQRSETDAPQDARKAQTKSVSQPSKRARARATSKLPEQYRGRDADGDGQIGLYEWPRSDLAGFRKLDRNGDGFLTVQELLRGPKSSAGNGSATVSSAKESSSTSQPRVAGGGSKSSGDNSGPKPSNAPPDISTRAASSFNLVDKDKDGRVSEEEWKRSFSAKRAFENAGIAVKFPLSKEEFVRQFPKAYPPQGG